MSDPRSIVIRPVISEKSMVGIREGQYTFIVAETATKTQVKDAIEKIFGVTVERVNTVRQVGKLRRMGRTSGYTPSFKKAVVTLTPGQTIKAFEGMM